MNQMGNQSEAKLPQPTNEMGEKAQALSYGEKAVGLMFNTSNDDAVGQIKKLYANVIDNLNALRMTTEDGEAKRLYSIAITEAQGAQMWGVKAIT